MTLTEPLDDAKAKRLIVEILRSGTVSFTGHALEALADDGMTTVDVANVLRGGWVEFSELVRGSWRYRVRTRRMAVVVCFRSETHLAVVTAWRED